MKEIECYYCGEDDVQELTQNYTGEAVCFSCSDDNDPCRYCRCVTCQCDNKYDEYRDRQMFGD